MEELETYKQRAERLKKQRHSLLWEAHNSARVRSLLIEKCARSPEFFINQFIWTLAQTADDLSGFKGMMPFVMYNYQQTLLEAILSGDKVAIPKSRKLGVTYTVLAVFLWSWLFEDDSKQAIGTMASADLISNAESSLFGKLELMLDKLPNWMVPEYTMNRDSGRPILKNDHNGNTIQGNLTTTRAFRSGRFVRIFIDEAAFVDKMGEVIKGAVGASDSVILCSTANGMNWFGKLIAGDIADIEPYPGVNRDSWKELRLHWSDDPYKNQEWKERTIKTIGSDAFGMEYDIDFNAAVEGIIFRHFNRESHVLVEPIANAIERLLQDSGVFLIECYDTGLNFAGLWSVYDSKQDEMYVIDYVSEYETHIDDIVELIQERRDFWGSPHYILGDRAAKQRTAYDKSSYALELSKRGIELTPVDNTKVLTTVQELQRAFEFDQIFIGKKCSQRYNDNPCIVECLQQYKWDVTATKQTPYKRANERISHLMDCLRYTWTYMHKDSTVRMEKY